MVAIFINPQILIDETSGFEAEVFRNSVNVFLGEKRAGGFAAIGALKAVCAGKNFFVCVVKSGVNLSGFFGLERLQQLLMILFLSGGLLAQRAQIHLFGLVDAKVVNIIGCDRF